MVDVRARISVPAVLAVLAVSLVAGACGGGGDDTGPPPTCLPDCPGDRTYDAVGYDLHARFDWATTTLTASEDITVAIASSPVIELDAGMTVTAVHAGEAQLAYVADPATSTMRVDLTPIATTAGTSATFTVDYTVDAVAASTALRMGVPRDDDPVLTHVVYTDSEPDRARQWLVSKDSPDDRALWSVDVTVAPDQDVLGNGARVTDEAVGSERRVGYALDKPIPTYMMAFAAGDIVHTDRTTGRVPLAVWYRRGLALDPDATLDVVADAMATFEAKLGPYPWDSYSVFLAPGYGGGMENATITFNAETSGQGNVSFGLNAHELAHHWFGDWVTMRTYNDVWVKEGMATLLASEADRARRDRTAGAPRLFGADFSFDPSESIVDTSLTGLDKYNSGPYERAAWLITQIREDIGDDAFWTALRGVLDQHAVGTITGEEFIASFPLDPTSAAHALASLPSHDAPAISVSTADDGTGGTALTLTLFDPGATIIAPVTVSVVDANGLGTTRPLVLGTPVDMDVPAGGYFAPDEADVHADWWATFAMQGDLDQLFALETPDEDAAGTTPEALAAFASRSAVVQERLFSLPTTSPAPLASFYAALDSDIAQRDLALAMCQTIGGQDGPTAVSLTTALAPALAAPPLVAYSTTYGRCGIAVTSQLGFDAELASLVDAIATADAGRLEYLLGFDYGTATSLDLIGQVATTAPSLRLRDRAIARLASQVNSSAYAHPAAGELPAWKTFFRDRLATTTSQNRLLSVWSGSYALADLTVLPTVGAMLHTVPLSDPAGVFLVCQAVDLTGGTGSDWAAFQTAAMPFDTLGPDTAAVLADPASCGAAKRAAPAPLRRGVDGEHVVERADR